MLGKIKSIFTDKDFIKQTLTIAIPVTLQSLIMSSVNTIDTFMITQLGTNATAGVGLANQVFFFFNFFLFGINTGSSALFSRYFGSGNLEKVQKTLGYAIKISFLISFLFTIASFFYPEHLLRLFTDNVDVIKAGAIYLKTVCLSFIITSFSFTIGVGMRSIGNAKTPLIATLFAFFSNSFFNYCFMFGKFGFPELGVQGAAVGTIIAKFIEFFILVYVIKKYRSPLYSNFNTAFSTDRFFRKSYFIFILPVIVEEVFWSLSQVLYNKTYAMIGVDATASMQIAGAISGLLYIACRGLGSSSTVLVATKLGENNRERAQDIAVKSSILGFLMGGIIGIFLILFPGAFLVVFNKLTPEVYMLTKKALVVLGIYYAIRTYNSVAVVGVLRGGGDIKFSMIVELACAWLIGVPVSFVAVIFFNVDLPTLMLLLGLEEIAKAICVTPRIINKKWMKNLVKAS